MRRTITVRLDEELASWLADVSSRTGVSQGRIIRDQLEKAKTASRNRPFLRLAGAAEGPRKLSSRKGFSRS
jgi:hypothetical protein